MERQRLRKEFSITMRRRSLGNIRFIGELFKLRVVSETFIHDCITRLLELASDESLEYFSMLLIITTGKDMEKPEAMVGVARNWVWSSSKPRLDAYFKRISDIVKKGEIPARIKFMLQDVQELRDHMWVPRERQDQQLKTIDQVYIYIYI